MTTRRERERSCRVLLLGVGNEDRGDDGIGAAIVRAVAGDAPAGVACAIEPGEVTRLTEAWEGYDAVLLVDAAAMLAPPGVLVHHDADDAGFPPATGDPSSHGLGVAEAVRLSAALGTLPKRMHIISINGEDFGLHRGLSPALCERLPRFTRYINQRLAQLAAEARAGVAYA